MKRTTVFLEEALERELQAIARQGNRPMASVVREALAEYVATREPADTPALSFVGAGASGRSDIAERHEELLWLDARAPAKTRSITKTPRATTTPGTTKTRRKVR